MFPKFPQYKKGADGVIFFCFVLFLSADLPLKRGYFTDAARVWCCVLFTIVKDLL